MVECTSKSELCVSSSPRLPTSQHLHQLDQQHDLQGLPCRGCLPSPTRFGKLLLLLPLLASIDGVELQRVFFPNVDVIRLIQSILT